MAGYKVNAVDIVLTLLSLKGEGFHLLVANNNGLVYFSRCQIETQRGRRAQRRGSIVEDLKMGMERGIHLESNEFE
ncbi:MAG: hypothetical protein JWP89_2466 [Schlesneria sp.]|nr:hypothetical protein [Schlesneria sp.]